LKKDGLDIGICDDVRNDWLAKELREENYHGCMDHGGAHAEGRANNRGWATKNAAREGYRECAGHEKRHFQKSAQQGAGKPVNLLGVVVAVIVLVNFLMGLFASR